MKKITAIEKSNSVVYDLTVKNNKNYICNGTVLHNCGYIGPINFRYKQVGYGNSYQIGERVGQIIIMPYPKIQFEEVEELEETQRGANGFGSTGN